MSIPHCNLNDTLVLMCLASHFDIIENWKLIVGYRDIYYAKKILNSFLCVKDRILVVKWNIYEAHIFPRPLVQTCRLETTSICLNTRLGVIKKFPDSHYFYWIYCKHLSFCAHTVMTSIILHTRSPNCQ